MNGEKLMSSTMQVGESLLAKIAEITGNNSLDSNIQLEFQAQILLSVADNQMFDELLEYGLFYL